MKFPRHLTNDNGDDQLIPLINVVFLMLIFFMVVGRLAPTDRLPINPPTSQSHQTAVENSITINVTLEGRLTVGDTPVTPDLLTVELRRSLDAAMTNGQGQPEIHIKADAKLTMALLSPILERLRDNDLSKVRVLTSAAR